MIYIIRHGQTAMNRSHALQGRSDQPLNEKGIAQANAAGSWLASQNIVFDHVYSSPLQRAVQTAHIAAPGIPVTIDERLIEMDYGPYEGADLKTPSPELVRFFRDFVNNPAPEGMEQLADVVKRCGSFLEEIKDCRGNFLISTHAIAMKGLLEYLTPESRGSYWSKYIGNCSVYAADVIDGHYTVPKEIYFEQI